MRLDPGEGRIRSARSFHVWEGGGEYNVARSLRKCFGLRTTVVTALADNPVGRLIEDLILQGGVDTSHVRWVPYDGIGRTVRNGINFTERGFGVRAPLGCSDRGYTAASQLMAGDVDWSTIFVAEGARWLHSGGIFAGLSETTAYMAEEAMRAAREAGTVVSYDLNFRPSLWRSMGGAERSVEVNRFLLRNVDVVFGNEEDFVSALGYDVSGGLEAGFVNPTPERYEDLLRTVTDEFPNLKVAAVSLRGVRSASAHDWSGACFADGRLIVSESLERLEILDRVGGGDSFAAGMIYGLLSNRSIDEALRYAVAHGALAMTTPGDASMATLAEVEALMVGTAARIER